MICTAVIEHLAGLIVFQIFIIGFLDPQVGFHDAIGIKRVSTIKGVHETHFQHIKST